MEEEPLEEALNYYPGRWRTIVTNHVEQSMASGQPYEFEAEFVTRSGTHKWVRAAGECERQNDKPIRLFGIFQDVTAEKEAHMVG